MKPWMERFVVDDAFKRPHRSEQSSDRINRTTNNEEYSCAASFRMNNDLYGKIFVTGFSSFLS